MAGNSASLPLHDLQNNLSGVPLAQPPASFAPTSNTPAVALPTQAPSLAPKPAAVLPKVSFSRLEEAPLVQVVQSAGMVWVGTDASKLAEAQTQMNAEPVKPRAERIPKPPMNLPSGPMVLVETGGQEKMIDKN